MGWGKGVAVFSRKYMGGGGSHAVFSRKYMGVGEASHVPCSILTQVYGGGGSEPCTMQYSHASIWGWGKRAMYHAVFSRKYMGVVQPRSQALPSPERKTLVGSGHVTARFWVVTNKINVADVLKIDSCFI